MQWFMPALALYAVCVCPVNCHHRLQEMQILDATHIIGSKWVDANLDHRGHQQYMIGQPILKDQPTLNEGDV